MARSVRRSLPVQLARQPEIEVCVMPAKDPQNTGLKNGQGNRPAPTQSSTGKAACSPFPVTDPSSASDSHKMTYRHSATCCTENRTQKHKNPALILEPVFNQASNEEFGAGLSNGADASQWKGPCARGGRGTKADRFSQGAVRSGWVRDIRNGKPKYLRAQRIRNSASRAERCGTSLLRSINVKVRRVALYLILGAKFAPVKCWPDTMSTKTIK